jgi:hypothetical protein
MKMQEKMSAELKQAMIAKDETRMLVLRGILTELKNERVKKMKDLTEGDELAVLQHTAKMRKDSIEQFTAGGRMDLADNEAAELKIIESYLPAQMSEGDIEEIVRNAIKDTGAAGQRDMGKVMKHVMEQCRGRADGNKVKEIVTRLLS